MLDTETIRLLRLNAKQQRAEAEEHERANRHDAAETCRARASAYEDRAKRAETQLQRSAHE